MNRERVQSGRWSRHARTVNEQTQDSPTRGRTRLKHSDDHPLTLVTESHPIRDTGDAEDRNRSRSVDDATAPIELSQQRATGTSDLSEQRATGTLDQSNHPLTVTQDSGLTDRGVDVRSAETDDESCEETGEQQPLLVSDEQSAHERAASRVVESLVAGDRSQRSIRSMIRTASSTDHEERPNYTTTPPAINRVLEKSGRPLDSRTRSSFESLFGSSFAGVRIHTGHQAAVAARSVNAMALTVGSDIVFARDAYRPGTAAGRALLAEELVHVRQQAQLDRERVDCGPISFFKKLFSSTSDSGSRSVADSFLMEGEDEFDDEPAVGSSHVPGDAAEDPDFLSNRELTQLIRKYNPPADWLDKYQVTLMRCQTAAQAELLLKRQPPTKWLDDPKKRQQLLSALS